MKLGTSIFLCLGAFSLQAAPVWQAEDYRQIPHTQPAPEVEEPGLTSLYFEGPDFNGKPTQVFAFIGLPENATAEQPVPGVVLVHGGGGTAFARWVRQWNAHGYAAIALDHYGQNPIRDGKGWQRNPLGGPGSSGIDSPPEAQWMFHAVADTMLAHSLLASMPEVDASRIGMVGVSWGAVIVCNVSGLDDRFRFAVPIYGCGFISVPDDEGSQFVGLNYTPEQRERWQNLWDPASNQKGASMSFLWMTGTNDFAFTLSALMRTSELVAGSQTYCIRIGMPHGQQVAEKPDEPIAFADSIVRNGPTLPHFTESGIDDGQAWINYSTELPVTSAQLVFTQDTGIWKERTWQAIDLALKPVQPSTLQAQLPEDTQAYFFNLTDERGLLVSSPPVILRNALETLQ